jgi:acetyl esterase/lipase
MASTIAFDVDIRDVEYRQQAGTAWLARVYQPRGAGPFPTVLDVHGGAWNTGDRLNDAVIDNKPSPPRVC